MGKNITIMADEEKSYNCRESSRLTSADSYITFYDNITICRGSTNESQENTELDRTVIRALIKNTERVNSARDDKEKELRDKRYNVSVYHDWCLANQTAEFTEESLICVGNISFRQTQFRGNGMPKLRKRIGYSYILCHSCGSEIDAYFNAAYNILKKIYPLAVAIWAYNNSFRNALRCQDDWLKVQMNMKEKNPMRVHKNECPPFSNGGRSHRY